MKTPTIKDLYPHLSNEQLEIVEDQLEQYLSLVLRIHDRIVDEKGYDGLARMIEDVKANKLSTEQEVVHTQAPGSAVLSF